VSAHPARLAPLALVLAAILGIAVGGISHLSAVDGDDPRPAGFVLPSRVPAPVPTITPEVTATLSPSPEAPATPTLEPDAEVWLYEVQSGDSISGVAIRFGTTTEGLLALNPEYQDNVNLVEAGSELIVPCTPIADTEDRC